MGPALIVCRLAIRLLVDPISLNVPWTKFQNYCMFSQDRIVNFE